jgi:cell division protein FtsN
MATRKGNGRQAVRNKSGGFPGWGYAIIGILVGAALMLVVMRHSLLPMAPKGPQPNADATAEHASESGLEPSASDTAPKKPQYDFYSVLSEKEVRIPDAQISAQARAEQKQEQQAAQQQAAQQQQQQAQPTTAAAAPVHTQPIVTQTVTAAAVPAPPPSSAGGYLLQVGAFPSASDAESLKARMALQGFVANVQSVDVGGHTYHRVRLGPFRSATELESTKQRLAAAGINNAIALKEGK